MDNGLIARVAAAADISPDVARKAVALVQDFILREAPEHAVKILLAKAPALRTIVASGAATGGEGMSSAVMGLMGTGAGAMGGGGLRALGDDLRALGLDQASVDAVAKELADYAREKAGDDVVDEISAGIPGLAELIASWDEDSR
jgi:hypothetical protein